MVAVAVAVVDAEEDAVTAGNNALAVADAVDDTLPTIGAAVTEAIADMVAAALCVAVDDADAATLSVADATAEAEAVVVAEPERDERAEGLIDAAEEADAVADADVVGDALTHPYDALTKSVPAGQLRHVVELAVL